MPEHAPATPETSHASRPFFGGDTARATPFFTPSPPAVVRAQADVDAEVDEGTDAVIDARPAPTVQAKLTLGAPDDPFEREADASADLVLQRLSADEPFDPPPPPDLGDGPGDRVQGKAAGAMDVPASVAQVLQSGTGSGTALQPALRDDMESAFDADFSAVRVHVGAEAERLNDELHARAFTRGRDIWFNAGEYQPGSTQGQHLLAHELTHVLQQGEAGVDAAPLRRQPKPGAKPDPNYVPYQIRVATTLDTEQFKALAMQQIFGGPVQGVTWSNFRTTYEPANNPFTVRVAAVLLGSVRGSARTGRGFSVDAQGAISGAADRAASFKSSPASDRKAALLKEIDDRYYAATGDATRKPIEKGETGKAALWNMIRDEVLAQDAYIANLPPQVRELIRTATGGKVLTPADYERLFGIAKKIERMPAGEVADYVAKVRGTTTDLAVFEASLDRYLAEMAERVKQKADRQTVQDKLVGLEEVYRKYRTYKSLAGAGGGLAAAGLAGSPAAAGAGLVTARESNKAMAELNTLLQAYDFANIDAFEARIRRFETSFEQESALVAKDLLERYAGKLYRESVRYADPAEVAAQHQALGGYRQSFAEFEANAAISNDYAAKSQQGRVPGQWQVHPATTQDEAKAAYDRAVAAKTTAQSQFKALAATHPVLDEDGLPDDRKIDKTALARADATTLGPLLQQRIALRLKDIDTARGDIDAKPELIYTMNKLMPQFYVRLGIKSGSIFDMIIQDKLRQDAILKLVKGLAFALVAIALSVVTFGAATPAIVAAGAGLAGAALGTWAAIEEIRDYATQKDLAAVGFADDPSLFWVVVAVVGAGLDIAASVKALKALGPAARLYNASGDAAEFSRAVRALEKAGEIEGRVARAAEKALEGRKGMSAAFDEFLKALGKTYSFPGPLVDPDVYKAVVKLAWNAAKTGFYDLSKFIDEIRIKHIQTGFGELTPKELEAAKRAWEEGKGLHAAEVAFEAAEQAKVGTYTTKIKWGIQNVDARPHGAIKGAFWGKRTPQAKPRVDAFELKINPNNESIFLPHPDGGFVQFENMVGTTVAQDGKLIIEQRSIYHVADMPKFAAEKVLAEGRRQVAAASAAGAKVEWLVSDSKALSQMDALFKKEGVSIQLTLFTE